jgi:hypothetical protein
MTQFQQPVVVEHDTSLSLLFLSELWISAEAHNLKVSVYRTPGTLAEAEVTDGDGNVLLKERIDMRAMLTGWLTDLLTRAEKGGAQ